MDTYVLQKFLGSTFSITSDIIHAQEGKKELALFMA